MTGTPRRVAITGLGLVTPLGNDVAATWRALLAGRSGVAPITHFDASGFPVRIAAEVKEFHPGHATEDRNLLECADRSTVMALAAAEEALRDAGIRPEGSDATRWACVVGSGKAGLGFGELEQVHRHCAPDGHFHPERLLSDGFTMDPQAFWRSQTCAGLALLLHRFGIRGYATSVHTACASGSQDDGEPAPGRHHRVGPRDPARERRRRHLARPPGGA